MSESKDTPATTAPQGPELVEIFIDGEAKQVPKGKNLLEALLDVGEDVSYFCYHPGLSVVAKCRQCLVGIGDAHKLVPSCQMNVADGMKVRSKTEQVREARRALLEFTLVNHPVDCVICDKAGECALQRQYMDWDGAASEVNHDKVHKPKKVDLGPEIVLDAERCILCDRCVRFCREIAKQPQLVFSYRADHTILTTAPGEQLDSPYALNTVDICPVGALTDKEFRFKSRVWELWSTRSVCAGCAAGCGMEIHHKDGKIHRLVPPRHWDMNENWMCNFGRRTYKAYEAMQRLERPHVDDNECDTDAALARIKEGLAPFVGNEELGAQVAFVIGADVTNEDNWAATKLAGLFPGSRLFLGEKADDDQGDDILRRNDPNPNRTGAKAVGAVAGEGLSDTAALETALKNGELKVLYVLGSALELASGTLRKLAKSVDMVVVQAPESTALGKRATVLLPSAAWPEVDGTMTNEKGETKRLRVAFEPPAEARPHWDWLRRVVRSLGGSWEAETAEQLFNELVGSVPGLAQASWGKRLLTQRLRFGGRRG